MGGMRPISIETEPTKRRDHIAARFGPYILVTGGLGDLHQPLPLSVIWLFDLHGEVWTKHWIPAEQKVPAKRMGVSAVMLDSCVYMFGGDNRKTGEAATNELWKLSVTARSLFKWEEIITPKRHSPSPRIGHTAWEYGNRMWVFGGMGPMPDSYLKSNEDEFEEEGENNQLLSFEPLYQQWTLMKTEGAKPEPRSEHATANIGNKVYVCGGNCLIYGDSFSDVHELDLDNLSWSKIVCTSGKPCSRQGLSLTAISPNELFLHGGGDGDVTFDDSWIFNVKTHRWREYRPNVVQPHQQHRACPGLDRDVIITGGGYRVNDYHMSLCSKFHHKICPRSRSFKELIAAIRKSRRWAKVQWKLYLLIGLLFVLILIEILMRLYGMM